MFKKNYNLYTLSKERNSIFGIAILLIVFFHSSIIIPNELNILKFIKHTGEIGVDIFLFLSGIGLYFSFSKNNNIKYFYKKRAIRVLIPYLIISPAWYILRDISKHETISRIFMDISFSNFWIYGERTEWFIAAIIVFYLIYPIIHKIMDKSEKLAIALIVIVFIINLIINLIWNNFYNNTEIFLTRIPVFLCGCLIAKKVKEKKSVNFNIISLCSITIIALIIVLYNNYPNTLFEKYLYYLYCPLSICLCIVFSSILNSFNRTNFIYKMLLFFGAYTLEIYLTHEKVLAILKSIKLDNYNLVLNVIAFIIAIISSYILKWLCNLIYKKVLAV